jgi:hypothetical protein
MKLTLSAIACAAFLAAPANSMPGTTGEYLGIVNTVKEAEKAFGDAQPTKPYWQDIKSKVDAWTDLDLTKKEQLQRAIDDLIERAQNAAIYMEDFWRMRAKIIDAECSTAIRILWKKAKNRDATRTEFEYVADLLRQRADEAKEAPDLRAMLQKEIEKLMNRYIGGEKIAQVDMSMFDDEAIRSMLDRSIAWLEDMAVKRHATREQFTYVRDLFRDRARIWSEDVEFQTLLRRVEAEIDRLMNRDLTSASFGRDDFLKLREMVLKKARDVVSSGGAAGL